MLNKIRKMESMEEIRSALNSCKKGELLEMAEELQLTGVKSWGKAKLVDFIATTQKHRIESIILAQVEIKANWQKEEVEKVEEVEEVEEIISVPAVIEYKDTWEFKINDNGKETVRLFNSKKEAKEQLNKVAKSLAKMFNLEKFYSEKSNWYELLILANEDLDEDEIADGNNITLEIKLVEEEMMEEE